MSLQGTYYFLSTRRVFLPYLREVKESPVFVAPDLLINVLVAEELFSNQAFLNQS